MESSPQVIEPQTLETKGSELIGIVQEELEELELNFHETLKKLDKLIGLEAIDFENDEELFTQKAEQYLINTSHKKTSLSLMKISKLEIDLEDFYEDLEADLKNANQNSYAAYSKNFDALYDEQIKSNELRQLEKSSIQIIPIEIDSQEPLNLDIDLSKGLDVSDATEEEKICESADKETKPELKSEVSRVSVSPEPSSDVVMSEADASSSKDDSNIKLFQNQLYDKITEDDIYRLLRIEKIKRARISFTNENVFKPEISRLRRELDKWNSYDDQLKMFLTRDIAEMNRTVQAVKKKEKL